MPTNETTSTKDLRTLRKMLRLVVSDTEVTTYSELNARASVSRMQRERFKEDYPSFRFVLHLMLDFNQAEGETVVTEGDDDE